MGVLLGSHQILLLYFSVREFDVNMNVHVDLVRPRQHNGAAVLCADARMCTLVIHFHAGVLCCNPLYVKA